jgi:hypothetical protein
MYIPAGDYCMSLGGLCITLIDDEAVVLVSPRKVV